MNRDPALEKIQVTADEVQQLYLKKKEGTLTEEEFVDLDRKFEELVFMTSDLVNSALDSMVEQIEETSVLLRKANDELQKSLESWG